MSCAKKLFRRLYCKSPSLFWGEWLGSMGHASSMGCSLGSSWSRDDCPMMFCPLLRSVFMINDDWTNEGYLSYIPGVWRKYLYVSSHFPPALPLWTITALYLLFYLSFTHHRSVAKEERVWIMNITYLYMSTNSWWMLIFKILDRLDQGHLRVKLNEY